jgi:hypothetical protein
VPDAPATFFMISAMYDSDDAFNRSPPLEVMKPNYGENETPPPFARSSEKDADAVGSRKPNQLKPQNSTREGDRVLMEFLAPYHPEIAASARTRHWNHFLGI